MKYMLLIYCDEKVWHTIDRLPFRDASVALCHELAKEGKYIAASPLKNVDTATSVRIREGKTLITDGPFAETHEQLGGYFLIDVENLEEAKAVAARIPSATVATVEIRPIEELEGMPEATESVARR